MSESLIVRWMQRQGHKTVKTQSSDWVEISPAIYQSVPYHTLVDPDQSEIDVIFKKHRALGLRYSTSLESKVGAVSYHVVYQKPAYSINGLPKKARHDVTRAQKRARVEPISFHRLAEEGWLLRYDTLMRQGRIQAENKNWWQALCESAVGLPGFEAWAVTIDGKLTASLIALTHDNCCSILYQQSLTEYLPLGVNNLLTFEFTNDVLNRSRLAWIFYGLHSLDAPASVDEFKFRMGYSAKPVRQRVVFNPIVAPFINNYSFTGLKAAHHILPTFPTLSKAEGMVRFYLQGKRPLADQDWPEALLEQKGAILAQMIRV